MDRELARSSGSNDEQAGSSLDTLSAIAIRLLASGKHSFSAHDTAFFRNAAEAIRIRTLPFLVQGERDGLSFVHKSLEEFFAARFLAREIQKNSPRELSRLILPREVIDFASGFEIPLTTLQGWLTEPPPTEALDVFKENVGALIAAIRKDSSGSVPQIRIKRLRLSKIKCFEDVTLIFPHQDGLSLMVGDNGVGKSTVLQSIALCALGPDLASRVLPLPDQWLRTGAFRGYVQATFAVSGLSGTNDAEVVIGLEITRNIRRINLVTKGPFASRNAETLLEARSKVAFSGLLVAGYGATRSFGSREDLRQGPTRDLVLDGVESLFESNKRHLEPGSVSRLVVGDGIPFREFGAPLTLSPEIRRSVADTLSRLLPPNEVGGFNSDGSYAGWFGIAEIDSLSDGYRSTLAWASHLVVHLLAAGRWSKGLNEVPGLVLIDEIDLHLHPRWQRVVIDSLRHAFPNLQFIVTTHSPLVTADAELGSGHVFLLKREGDQAVVEGDIPSVKGWRVDQILASELFGYIIGKDPDTERILGRASMLAGKGDKRSFHEEQEYWGIMAKLKERIIPTGQTLAEREVQKQYRDELSEKARVLEKKLFGEEE